MRSVLGNDYVELFAAYDGRVPAEADLVVYWARQGIARPYAILGNCRVLVGHVDQGTDLLTQARAANPRFWWLHLNLAGALGFKGDLDGARSALAEAVRLKPEVNSLAQWHAHMPWVTDPRYLRLTEPTLYVGLRRVGFPDQ